MRQAIFISAIASCFISCTSAAKHAQFQHLPPLREQAEIQDGWRQERLDKVPALLEKYNVDAWLLSQREYGEDTAFWSMKLATQFSARRRTVDIFFAEHINCSHHNWIDITPKVWSDLTKVLEDCQPGSIVVNTDPQDSFAGGLHAGERDLIVGQLGPYWSDKLINKPEVATEFIAAMPRSRLQWYKKFMETSWAIIEEAFSNKVVTPGKTTTADIEWFMREKIQALNYTTWFQPGVSILDPSTEIGPPNKPATRPIEYGDVLHCDFGVTAMGLNTDTQHLAYVLAPGESYKDIPQGLIDGLKAGNQLQDIVKNNVKIGLTGNEILKNVYHEMHSKGLKGKIYSHPIGDWGHAAGTYIGLFGVEDGVPLGDFKVFEGMYYSVELFATHDVPERNGTWNFYLEEDIFWDEETDTWEWVYGRQEKFHLVRPRGDSSLKIQS